MGGLPAWSDYSGDKSSDKDGRRHRNGQPGQPTEQFTATFTARTGRPNDGKEDRDEEQADGPENESGPPERNPLGKRATA